MTTLSRADETSRPSELWLQVFLVLAAFLGRLSALGSWWTLDDWGQLGRPAHLLPEAAGWPARILSQHWWWSLNWTLWGLNPYPQAVIRMLLHSGAAWLVARIGRKCGLPPAGWFAAGLVFAATPLAFTPLYWASGIQELLAGFLALLAVERWLEGTRRAMLVAVGAAVLSFLAKESGLGLPLLLLAILWWGVRIQTKDRPFALTLVALTLVIAVTEAALVATHFATGPTDPYALGGPGTLLTNLGTFGWWLLSPGPLLAARVSWIMSAAGAAFFLLWGLWAGFRMPAGFPLPAASLLAALLVIAPALPLRTQVHPYLAYLAVAPLSLVFASLIPWHRIDRGRWILLLALPAALWPVVSMRVRLESRNALGLPADPVVRATSLSWSATRMIRTASRNNRAAGPDATAGLVLYQQPGGTTDATDADRFGPQWVAESELYQAWGGTTGPILATSGDVPIAWRSALTGSPAGDLVLAADATGFKVWGPVSNAVYYAAVTDVALGQFERARRHLLTAAALNPATTQFIYDEGQMIVPVQLALKNLKPFIDWTVRKLGQGSSLSEVGGIQDMFLHVMSSCTGKSMDELMAGSKVLLPETTVPPPAAKEK